MSIPAGQDTDVALDVELALADAGFIAEIIPWTDFLNQQRSGYSPIAVLTN